MAQNHREVSSKCALLELSIKFGRKLYLGLVSRAKSVKNELKLQTNTVTPQFGQHNMKENGSKSKGHFCLFSKRIFMSGNTSFSLLADDDVKCETLKKDRNLLWNLSEPWSIIDHVSDQWLLPVVYIPWSSRNQPNYSPLTIYHNHISMMLPKGRKKPSCSPLNIFQSLGHLNVVPTDHQRVIGSPAPAAIRKMNERHRKKKLVSKSNKE